MQLLLPATTPSPSFSPPPTHHPSEKNGGKLGQGWPYEDFLWAPLEGEQSHHKIMECLSSSSAFPIWKADSPLRHRCTHAEGDSALAPSGLSLYILIHPPKKGHGKFQTTATPTTAANAYNNSISNMQLANIFILPPPPTFCCDVSFGRGAMRSLLPLPRCCGCKSVLLNLCHYPGRGWSWLSFSTAVGRSFSSSPLRTPTLHFLLLMTGERSDGRSVSFVVRALRGAWISRRRRKEREEGKGS